MNPIPIGLITKTTTADCAHRLVMQSEEIKRATISQINLPSNVVSSSSLQPSHVHSPHLSQFFPPVQQKSHDVLAVGFTGPTSQLCDITELRVGAICMWGEKNAYDDC